MHSRPASVVWITLKGSKRASGWKWILLALESMAGDGLEEAYEQMMNKTKTLNHRNALG